MIHKLEPRDYEKVRALFGEWRSRLAVFAVIEGRCPGWIVVDDAQHPRTAFLWEHAEGEFYLAGAADNEAFNRALNDCIRRQIRPEAEAHLPHLSEYTLYCDPHRWGGQLDLVLEGMNPMQHKRLRFALAQLQVDWRSRVPEGFAMLRINEALLARRELRGVDIMREWLLGSWRSAADFARTDLGFCLVHGDDLVSWCASEHICQPVPGGGQACEVGIYTMEDYRRRGYATLTAAATVEHCLAQDIGEIGWHCWARNVASAATARKVGFELATEQVVYNGCYNPFDNLLLQAHYHAQANRIQEALARWERAFTMWEAQDPEAVGSPHCQAHPDTVGWCYYAAARARAGQGQRDAALSHLHKALDNGWADVKRLRGDDQLASLGGTPGWDALLARLGERA